MTLKFLIVIEDEEAKNLLLKLVVRKYRWTFRI